MVKYAQAILARWLWQSQVETCDASVHQNISLRLDAMKHGTEFAYESGVGYLGNKRVPRAKHVLTELLVAMAIRRVETGGCTTEYYRAADSD